VTACFEKEAMPEMSSTYDRGSALPSVSRTEVPGLRTWDRAGPALGILSWIMIMTGFFIHGYPATDASAQDLVRWAGSTDTNRFVTGIFIEDLGYPLLLIFVGWVCLKLWQAGGSAWLLGLGLASYTVWAGVGMADQGVWIALLRTGKAGADGMTLMATYQMASQTFNSINPVAGLAMVALGLGALAAVRAPHWIGWTAIAIGVAIAATSYAPANVSGPVGLLPLLWSIAIAIRYLVRPAPAAAA
jgi:hypothetical protein